MPVSTFSADSSHVRTRSGHSGIIARWNSTRDRIAEDEQNQVTEMDGTGLWERENWPLRPGDSGDSSRRQYTQRKKSTPVNDQRKTDQNAVFRNSEDIGREPEYLGIRFEDSNVSDVEEEEEAAGRGQEDDIDRLRDDIRETVLEAPRPRGRDVSPMRDNEPTSFLRSPSTQSLMSRPVPSSPTAPSPVYDEHDRGRQSPRAHPPRKSSKRARLQPAVDEDLYSVSPVRGAHARSDLEDTTDEDDLSERAPQHDSNGYPVNQSPDMEDEAPPAFAPSTPSANSHVSHSSISKTTPPQRQLSSRRSLSITTQIPFNKERVRYSWQSVKDDEPNRPRIHIIKLVSNTASASAGFPQGEAFNFSISPAGRRVAAFNSARLYILQTGALPVGVSQDYALKRRPLAVEVIDDGNLIAILADQHTVNLYDLVGERMTIVRSIKLDFPTSCIALAPTGGLLAAAYEGGVEIFSLDPNALPTDRRAVRSVKMDRMSFSEDGATLLGTTTRINVSSTVTVSVPVFPASQSNIPTHEELKDAWCSSLLHPENIRNSSHATFMRKNRETCNDKLFAWNGLADTFGILNIADLQYGNIDFPVVISPPLSTCGGLGAAIHSPPAIDEHGDTVAMIVNDRTIRLYIVPHRVPDDYTTVEAHSIDHELDEGYGCPFSEVKWVYSTAALPSPASNPAQVQGRLIVVSPGGVVDPTMAEEPIDDIEGGRIIMFDFDPQFAGQPGQTFSLTLGKNPPQLLEEPQVDVAQEVALVRRRTVNQSKGNGLSQRPVTLGRAASTFEGKRNRERPRNENARGLVNISTAHRRSIMSINSLNSEATRSLPDLMETSETYDTFEEPYALNAPRSHASLQRAATNAQRHRFQTIEEKSQERSPADSSGGFLPLPEYTEEPNAPLPSRFRAMAGLDTPAQGPKKAAIVTSPDGEHSRPTSNHSRPTSSAPMSAPPLVGANFNSESAFTVAITEQNRAASALQRRRPEEIRSSTPTQNRDIPSGHLAASSPTPGVQRSDTFDSIGPLPRNLARAYSRGPVGTGPPPNLMGDWANANRLAGSGAGNSSKVATGTSHRGPSTVLEEESWDDVAPVGASNRHPAHAADPRTSSANGFTSPLPERNGSAASEATYSGSSYLGPHTSPNTQRDRRPPHMQFLARAAANNAAASASLFPATQSPDHVPLRSPTQKAGDVAHPVTAWHPPAASTPSLSSPGLQRSHSRKSSTSQRSAFASTTKARDPGFFKSRRGKRKVPFDPSAAQESGGWGGRESRRGGRGDMETKSMFTTFTWRGDGKCAMM